MGRPEIAGISPSFIVKDAAVALAFYRDSLGFEITFQEHDQNNIPFFGIVCRGRAMIMLKSVGIDPLPNHRREPYVAGCGAPWDAYVSVPDPDGLYAEFASRKVQFSTPPKEPTHSFPGLKLKAAHA